MIRVIEIYSDPFKMRETEINPVHIVKMTPEPLDGTKLGFAPEQEYTRVNLVGAMTIVVVASLDMIDKKIKEQSRLLKG